jgi:DNA-binding transcriptional LysR family regulator
LGRENLNDLSAFVAVAQARSFTKAAAQLGISPSALSHAMRGLEERLGVRLLARTTRSVAPTEAGERLLAVVLPHLQGIESELSALNLLRDVPAGTIRLTASEHAAYTVIYPVLARLAADYPEIKIEVNVDNMLKRIPLILKHIRHERNSWRIRLRRGEARRGQFGGEGCAASARQLCADTP